MYEKCDVKLYIYLPYPYRKLLSFPSPRIVTYFMDDPLDTRRPV